MWSDSWISIVANRSYSIELIVILGFTQLSPQWQFDK